jgi:hypothetical protein
MVRTDTDSVTKTDAELLIFDVSDDALERAAPIIGGAASVVTLNFGTGIVGNCGCPCIEVNSPSRLESSGLGSY